MQHGPQKTVGARLVLPPQPLVDVVDPDVGLLDGMIDALKSDGTVWAFGWNAIGQIGDGAVGTSVLYAVQVPGLTNVVSIAAGLYLRYLYKGSRVTRSSPCPPG